MNGQQSRLLDAIVRRESRSFLQYIRESFPWAAAGEKSLVERLDEISASEDEALIRLGRYLERRGRPVGALPQFPMAFTTRNFVSVDSLLPQIVEEARRGVVVLERDLKALSEPEARALVQAIVDLKRRHVQTLEELSSSTTV